jgi:DNA-binding IclR family transcriptional regulator
MTKKSIDEKSRYTSLTPAVEQAAEIIKHVASSSKTKLSCTEISKALGINLSKTYVVLDALQKSGFISKETDGKLYSLGFGLISIGQVALERAKYHDAVKPFLTQIAGETACTASFHLVTDDSIVITAIESPGRAIESRIMLGSVRPRYYRCIGRILASYLSKNEQELLIKSKTHAFYNKRRQLTDRAIMQDLSLCRKNGFAHHTLDEDPYGMVNAIASAVFDVTNMPIGSFLTIGLFPKNLVGIHGSKVRDAANRFSVSLGANIQLYNEEIK